MQFCKFKWATLLMTTSKIQCFKVQISQIERCKQYVFKNTLFLNIQLQRAERDATVCTKLQDFHMLSLYVQGGGTSITLVFDFAPKIFPLKSFHFAIFQFTLGQYFRKTGSPLWQLFLLQIELSKCCDLFARRQWNR